jgi:tryptophan synthase alpha subunit
VIGFGISSPEKVRQAARISDGVIVGTALIREMSRRGPSPAGLKQTAKFLKRLKSGLKH